jgi:hypothetical protein
MSLEAFVAALVSMVSPLPPDEARLHVEAAAAAATDQKLATELLLAVAYVESRYDPRALSRVECETADRASCVRKTGVWPKSTKPPKAQPSWYCGPLQSGGYVSWDECQKMRDDVAYGYSAGAKALVTWMRDPHCRQFKGELQLRCGLAGYNGGYAAVADPANNKYANWVLATRDRIVKFAQYAEQKAPKPEM